jgi:iron(III) transport system permease protein
MKRPLFAALSVIALMAIAAGMATAGGIGVDVYHLGFDLFGMTGLVFVQTITFFSVAYLILRGMLERLDPALEELSRVVFLGGNIVKDS